MHKSQQQQKAATHSLRFKNVSAACITCTTECTVVQRGLKFKCTWSKHSVCTAPQMCVCIVKLNNLCVCLCVNTEPLVLRSVIFSLYLIQVLTPTPTLPHLQEAHQYYECIIIISQQTYHNPHTPEENLCYRVKVDYGLQTISVHPKVASWENNFIPDNVSRSVSNEYQDSIRKL